MVQLYNSRSNAFILLRECTIVELCNSGGAWMIYLNMTCIKCIKAIH